MSARGVLEAQQWQQRGAGEAGRTLLHAQLAGRLLLASLLDSVAVLLLLRLRGPGA